MTSEPRDSLESVVIIVSILKYTIISNPCSYIGSSCILTLRPMLSATATPSALQMMSALSRLPLLQYSW